MHALTSSAPAHQVALVPPGQPSLAWLRAAVADLQADDPLAPVTVVVPSPYSGWVVRRALAEASCANVRTMVGLRQLAERIAWPGAHGGLAGPLTGVLESAAIRAAVQAAGGPPLARVAGHRALHDALLNLYREVRHLDEPGAAVATLAARGGPVAHAAAAVYRQFQAHTRPFYDVPALTRLAVQALDRGPATPSAVRDLGALVVYLPARLDGADVALLGRLGRHVPVHAAFAAFGQPLADRLLRESADQLTAALGLPAPADVPAFAPPPEQLWFVSAPDPAEEVRAVLRRVAGGLAADVPLWRTAVLYAHEDTYGPLVREGLDAAGLP